MQKYDASSAFLGYRGFPAHICASINEELVHGIPSKDRILKRGDIISIDIGPTVALLVIAPGPMPLVRFSEKGRSVCGRSSNR